MDVSFLQSDSRGSGFDPVIIEEQLFFFYLFKWHSGITSGLFLTRLHDVIFLISLASNTNILSVSCVHTTILKLTMVQLTHSLTVIIYKGKRILYI